MCVKKEALSLNSVHPNSMGHLSQNVEEMLVQYQETCKSNEY